MFVFRFLNTCRKSKYLEKRGGVEQSPITPQTDDEVDAVRDVIVPWNHTKITVCANVLLLN